MNSPPDTSKIQSVAVVGGSGFVGRHLVAKLRARGHRVTIFTRRFSDTLAAHLAPAELVEVDTESTNACINALKGHSAVINLAGILHESRGERFLSAHAELPGRLVHQKDSPQDI